jgi:hypothetical protein
MSAFQPAFEVTHVDSMQWNRTSLPSFEKESSGAPSAAPLSPEVLARVQAAVKKETAHLKR